MQRPILIAFFGIVAAGLPGFMPRLTLVAQTQGPSLQIVVIEGEDAVNVVQQKTAVAPVIEVRDRNNQPVAGAVVRFAIRNGRATFNGARAISVTTNAAGRAAAAGLTPTGSGALQISAAASFQGQSAAAVIAQTNVMTAAQAAAATATASTAGTGAGTGTGAGAGGGAAGGGTGGLSGTTIGVVGGAAAAGAVAVNELTKDPGVTDQTFSGRFQGTESLSFGGQFCRLESLTGTLELNLTIDNDVVTGTARNNDGAISTVSTSAGCAAFMGRPDSFSLQSAPVTGTTSNIVFDKAQTNVVPPNPLDPQGTTNTHDYNFTGSLNNGTISGTLSHRRIIGGTVAGTAVFQVTLQ
jgi:hypothetical protein